MPKSKIRRNSKFKVTHYNRYAGVLVGKSRVKVHGKRNRPIPGSKLRVNKLSPFMGSRVTPENRREYEAKQAEAFKEMYIRDVVAGREKIRNQKDKSKDEILAEIAAYNEEQMSEQELERKAQRFARYQSNKEKTHYSAWLAGKSTFIYKGNSFPVVTESFLKKTKSIHDIVPTEEK